jgi:hypothetical protein
VTGIPMSGVPVCHPAGTPPKGLPSIGAQWTVPRAAADPSEVNALNGFRWAYDSAAAKALDDYSEEDGHDATLFGVSRYTLFRDRPTGSSTAAGSPFPPATPTPTPTSTSSSPGCPRPTSTRCPASPPAWLSAAT